MLNAKLLDALKTAKQTTPYKVFFTNKWNGVNTLTSIFFMMARSVQVLCVQAPPAGSIINDTPGATEYGRRLKLLNDDWLAVVTVISSAQPWLAATPIAKTSESDNEVDYGQVQLMSDGSILAVCLSVIRESSFRLPVYERLINVAQ